MKLVVGCDEAAYQMKEHVKQFLIDKGHEVLDIGVYDEAKTLYPDVAETLCKEIVEKRCSRGILMCGTGIGMAITANKIPGIRAAVGHDLFSVERSIKSNHCQVLCMGARVIGIPAAELLIDKWLACEFHEGASSNKIERIMEIQAHYTK